MIAADQSGNQLMTEANAPPPKQESRRHAEFRRDMRSAGYEVIEYRGRNFYSGPAVRCERGESQDVMRATTIRVQTDHLGLGLIVYPA